MRISDIDSNFKIETSIRRERLDGVHPTDLGFMSMARAIIPVPKRALGK